ncbi:glycosyltransferase family 2 protein [Desulfonema magnum]|uniref:Glycosyl transferase, family II n=1 Tax=Desulfonema magnum TaxID=45655 RepID=A0A975BF33_9BACT|nr:glycosyltransferase family 2 protein [Desulfonema magnum]QTA84352.1 Glycosyl transferase, family II [Desulfonema magnum]
MKLSVIITTYNRPDMLRKVLEGLCHQTRPAYEVIIADDGSGPETLEVVRRFMDDALLPIYHVWQEDLGFRSSEIRNKAIRKSSGEYIIMLDGDCIPEKHFIEDHLCLAEKGFFFQGKRILVSRKLTHIFSYKDTDSKMRLLKHFVSGNISNSHHLVRLPFLPPYSLTRLNGIRGCNMGFFREDIFAINGYNQAFVGWGREDSELAVRFYKYGLKRKEHPFMAVCFHLWHEENNRKRLDKNDQLLKKAIDSDQHKCLNGLLQIR